jgi:hypothetical protein
VDAWRGKYSDPAASKFEARIEAGENTLGPYRLE